MESKKTCSQTKEQKDMRYLQINEDIKLVLMVQVFKVKKLDSNSNLKRSQGKLLPKESNDSYQTKVVYNPMRVTKNVEHKMIVFLNSARHVIIRQVVRLHEEVHFRVLD